MMTRQTLYKLIDSLPESEFQSAARYLQFLSLPQDEIYSEEETAAMHESWQQMQRGEVVAFEDVIQSLDPGFSLGQ